MVSLLCLREVVLLMTNKASKRTAWVGVATSVLLPVIFCEFIYLNAVAVPQYGTKVWATTLSNAATLQPPSIFVYTYELGPNGILLANATAAMEYNSCLFSASGNMEAFCPQNRRFNLTHIHRQTVASCTTKRSTQRRRKLSSRILVVLSQFELL